LEGTVIKWQKLVQLFDLDGVGSIPAVSPTQITCFFYHFNNRGFPYASGDAWSKNSRISVKNPQKLSSRMKIGIALYFLARRHRLADLLSAPEVAWIFLQVRELCGGRDLDQLVGRVSKRHTMSLKVYLK
jgi:hypothetical protein